jgi:cbb3-type cytochrome oxidase maturation protein
VDVIYGLLPGMLLLGIIGVALFFWAVRSGQYDDMDGAANRILMDDPEDTIEQPKDVANELEENSTSNKSKNDN